MFKMMRVRVSSGTLSYGTTFR